MRLIPRTTGRTKATFMQEFSPGYFVSCFWCGLFDGCRRHAPPASVDEKATETSERRLRLLLLLQRPRWITSGKRHRLQPAAPGRRLDVPAFDRHGGRSLRILV